MEVKTVYNAPSSKRPRSTTPQPIKHGPRDIGGVETIAAAVAVYDGSIRNQEGVRASNLRSADLATRNTELNELLQISANYDLNFSMQSDAILKALCEIIVFDVLNWKEPTSSDATQVEADRRIVFRSANAWKHPPTPRMIDWAKYCSNLQLDDVNLKICEVAAMILRNFSFSGANLRLLAYSPDILHVLVAFLYIGVNDGRYRNTVADPESTIQLSALQTLRHLVSCLDVTGQQLLTDKLFYDGCTMGGGDGPAVPNAEEFGKCVTGEWGGFGACWLAKRLDIREDTIENVPTELLLDLTSDYISAVWSIFPALHKVIVDQRSSRSIILTSLDFLQELINVARIGLVGGVQEEDPNIRAGHDYRMPTLRSVLVNLPDSILDRLTTLLYVPRVGPDSLE
jgi:hypothetical protein